MSRRKTGRERPTTLAEAVSLECGERVLSTQSAAKWLKVGEELLVGLARRDLARGGNGLLARTAIAARRMALVDSAPEMCL